MREHCQAAVRRTRPLVLRLVPIQLNPVAVGVAQVNRLTYPVVRGSVERDGRRQQSPQRVSQQSAARIENRHMKKARRARRRRRTTTAFPGVQSDVVMIATGGHKGGLRFSILGLAAIPSWYRSRWF